MKLTLQHDLAAPCPRIFTVEGLTMRCNGRPARTMGAHAIGSAAPAAAERQRWADSDRACL